MSVYAVASPNQYVSGAPITSAFAVFFVDGTVYFAHFTDFGAGAGGAAIDTQATAHGGIKSIQQLNMLPTGS